MVIKERINAESIYLTSLDSARISTEYVRWMQDPDVLLYLARPLMPYTALSISEYVEQMNASRTNYLLGLFDQKTNMHIGNIKIGNIHDEHRFADVGFVLGVKAFWGKGIMTQALQRVTHYAFDDLGLNKLFAGVLAPNVASMRVFEKAGYRQVGCYQRHCKLDHSFVDSYIYEKCAALSPGNT